MGALVRANYTDDPNGDLAQGYCGVVTGVDEDGAQVAFHDGDQSYVPWTGMTQCDYETERVFDVIDKQVCVCAAHPCVLPGRGSNGPLPPGPCSTRRQLLGRTAVG